MKQLISIFFSPLKEGVRWNVCLKGCVICIISINSYISIGFSGIQSFNKASGFNKQVLDFDDIRIDFKQEDIVLQGKKTIIKYKITNTSNAFLVFFAGMSKYGGVSKKDNKFYHNTMQQQHTPPVFFNFPEFIPPNSTTEKSFEIRPFKSGKIKYIDTLHYFKIDETNINKLFVYESKDGMALPGAPGTIVYRRIKDLDEFKNIITTSFSEILIPQVYQQDLKRTIRYELEIDIEENKKFQELYIKFKPKDIIELKEIANLALNTDNISKRKRYIKYRQCRAISIKNNR